MILKQVQRLCNQNRKKNITHFNVRKTKTMLGNNFFRNIFFLLPGNFFSQFVKVSIKVSI